MFTPVKHGIVPQIWQYLSPNYRAPDMPKIRINPPTFQSQSKHKLQKLQNSLTRDYIYIPAKNRETS